jgi:hypothetical protein
MTIVETQVRRAWFDSTAESSVSYSVIEYHLYIKLNYCRELIFVKNLFIMNVKNFKDLMLYRMQYSGK